MSKVYRIEPHFIGIHIAYAQGDTMPVSASGLDESPGGDGTTYYYGGYGGQYYRGGEPYFQGVGWKFSRTAGYQDAQSMNSSIERIENATDVNGGELRASFSATRYGMASVGNDTYGWCLGGGLSGYSTCERLTYADDLTSPVTRATLSVENTEWVGVSGSTYGWTWGGSRDTAGSRYIYQFAYASDTSGISSVASVTVSRKYTGATLNSTHTWCFGGQSYSSGLIILSNVSRMEIASYTTAAMTNLSRNLTQLCAVGDEDAGYIFGGCLSVSSGSPESAIERITYSTDTAATVATAVSRREAGLGTNNDDFGWFAGGEEPGSQDSNFRERLEFANDTTTIARGRMAVTRERFGATQAP